jgi:hypothetical protein
MPQQYPKTKIPIVEQKYSMNNYLAITKEFDNFTIPIIQQYAKCKH